MNKKLMSNVLLFSALNSIMVVGLWMILQVLVPQIADYAVVLDRYPEVLATIGLAAAVTYILNSLFK